jgi:hypothetical protein
MGRAVVTRKPWGLAFDGVKDRMRFGDVTSPIYYSETKLVASQEYPTNTRLLPRRKYIHGKGWLLEQCLWLWSPIEGLWNQACVISETDLSFRLKDFWYCPYPFHSCLSRALTLWLTQ